MIPSYPVQVISNLISDFEWERVASADFRLGHYPNLTFDQYISLLKLNAYDVLINMYNNGKKRHFKLGDLIFDYNPKKSVKISYLGIFDLEYDLM